jgi:hypothetical protein
MADFSYSLRLSVDKALPPITGGAVALDLCPNAASAQTPPRLQISLASIGTAAIDGVRAACFDIPADSGISLQTDAPFGTNATHTFLFIREVSDNPTAEIEILDSGPATLFVLKNKQAALIPNLANGQTWSGYANLAANTGTLQILSIGE